MIEDVVAPLLHNNDPVAPVAVNNELPQLSTTVTPGADGIVSGVADRLVDGLVHPFAISVCVTLYDPAVVTVIDAVVSPVFHVKLPVAPDAVNNELSQLSVTLTDGASGTIFGAATPLPVGLVQPFTVCVTV